ncbi:hypothetical protein AVEN_52108-1 [Araneus ventricosus]|uniref:Uncharacterized protein n=1 Tax=Araneus ventricosus TaxID=182803 RepID=A0A4Y2V1R9_ARAVE|nr:hypothetical protein AVEN_52108-1 [Araneus ventricosus]
MDQRLFPAPKLKEYLSGTRFSSDSDVKTATENWLNGQDVIYRSRVKQILDNASYVTSHSAQCSLKLTIQICISESEPLPPQTLRTFRAIVQHISRSKLWLKPPYNISQTFSFFFFINNKLGKIGTQITMFNYVKSPFYGLSEGCLSAFEDSRDEAMLSLQQLYLNRLKSQFKSTFTPYLAERGDCYKWSMLLLGVRETERMSELLMPRSKTTPPT